MLNRSMPSTAGATISIPPARAVYGVFQREVPSLDEEHNLQCSEKYTRWRAVFPALARFKLLQVWLRLYIFFR